MPSITSPATIMYLTFLAISFSFLLFVWEFIKSTNLENASSTKTFAPKCKSEIKTTYSSFSVFFNSTELGGEGTMNSSTQIIFFSYFSFNPMPSSRQNL